MKRIILAPDSFKGTMSAGEICALQRQAIARLLPEAEVRAIPMADGGEGMAEAYHRLLGGRKIAVTVTIYDASARGQNFGQVQNAFVRLVDKQTGSELLRFDLGEDYSTETAIVFAEIYRHNGEWKFSAVGSGFNGGLEALCRQYGLNV